MRLISLFANEAKQGSVMRSLIHVKGGDLQFVEEKDGWSKVTFDLLAVTFGDNGTVVDQVNRTENIRARAEALEDIKKNGFVYNVLVPVKKPGAYQMRVALRDATTSRVGSANQFIEVPNIKKNRLTLSGIVLDNFEVSNKNEIKNDLDFQTDTARRRFRTGTALQFAFVVYNARLDAASAKPNLQMQFKLFRDGKEIFTSRENAVETNGQSDLTRIQANGALQLADKMEAGEYVLQIVVKDLSAKEKRAVATQWIDFEVVQ